MYAWLPYRYFLRHDLQPHGDRSPPARAAPRELYGTRTVLLLRGVAQLDRPRQDPARPDVPRRVRVQLGLRVRHPDGAEGSRDPGLPRERCLAHRRRRWGRSIRVRLATHRAAGGARGLRPDRPRPLPHAHPGALKVGSADVPRLHVLGRRRQLDHEPRPAELRVFDPDLPADFGHDALTDREAQAGALVGADRKSTRLNSSHLVISYAVFCLKKKKKKTYDYHQVQSST